MFATLAFILLCFSIGISESKSISKRQEDVRYLRSDDVDTKNLGWLGKQWTKVRRWFKNIGGTFRGFNDRVTGTLEKFCASIKSYLNQYNGAIDAICRGEQFEFCKYPKELPKDILNQ